MIATSIIETPSYPERPKPPPLSVRDGFHVFGQDTSSRAGALHPGEVYAWLPGPSLRRLRNLRSLLAVARAVCMLVGIRVLYGQPLLEETTEFFVHRGLVLAHLRERFGELIVLHP